MKIKLLSVTYTDGTIRHSEAVYFDGYVLFSIIAFLADDYIEERYMHPTNKARDLVIKRSCKTVTKDGIIYGKVDPDYQQYIGVDDFIVENRHLRYVSKHSDEILAMLESKAKSNEQE
jgi:hypothetical protein